MDKRYDVIITGGGVTGSSTAYWLMSQADFSGSVLVVERDPSYENSPSARASGGIRQQFSTPENIQIGLFGAAFVKNIEQYLAVDAESTGMMFREQGYLVLATEETLPIFQANHAVQRVEGAQIVFKDRAELTSSFPWLRGDHLAGGFFGECNEGWVDPYGLLQAFRRKARALGADFVTDRAVELLSSAQRITGVRLASGGSVEAGAVVNTAGASGARALANSVGVALPIESRLRCSFVFECREQGISGAPLTILPSGVAWRPEGSKFLANVSPPVERDPETFEHSIDYDLWEDVIWPSLAESVPMFEAIKLVQTYSCHYDFNTLDENLIIGLAGDFENLYVAVGFSGHGMQQSPAVGRALSELICFGEYRSIDLSRFGYGRVLSGAGIHETNCW